MASILTTLARVKRRLQIPSAVTLHDDALTDHVDAVDTWLAGQLSLPAISVAAYSDTIDIERGDLHRIRLSYRPIQSVTSLVDDGDAIVSADYRIRKDEGFVELVDDGVYFTMGRGSVVCGYTAGFTQSDSIWADLQRAATDWCAVQFNQGPSLGLKRSKAQQREIELADNLPESARSVLMRYQRIF